MSKSFAELLEESLDQSVMSAGSVIPATVLRIEKDYVIVDGGFKSEGVIPVEEFHNEDGDVAVQVGDKVDVALIAIEDGFGETRLSREKAKRAEVWGRLETAHNDNETIMGIINGKVKGGFTVEIDSIRAFLPGSLVDVRPVRDPGYLEGKKLEFKVIKMDAKRNNVVVSRRAVVEEENSAERTALLDDLEEGKEIKGIVKNLTDYGAFIDLGGIDGLLHITDMSWKRIKHPSEMLNVGDEVNVVVLKFDKDRSRVSLGLKQMGSDPWSDITGRYPEGSKLHGKVTNITDYGCFVEIEDGVEGLVHVSEMSWTNKNIHPNKIVQLGDEVDVLVLEIDEDRRRISLGVKQCQENPWNVFAETHDKGDKVSGKIKSITDFGIFIGLDGDIDGLVHLNDISWNESGEQAIRKYKKGDELEALVLTVDPERERISLGIKQLEQDPFAQFTTNHQRGDIISGTVTALDPKGVTVDLGDGLEGFIRTAELSQDKVSDPAEVVKQGDQVEAKYMNIDRKTRMITLSIKAKDSEHDAEALKSMNEEAGQASTTLGDLLKEKMENNE
ncbi:MAG: 30S ribosomal protein S1 [Legionellales bacterium]|nr:30S ribosomal protein S1 [Legionellales bacterium]|tara:strand:- start:7144 stop:8817 length:1674 start_codon:yes stop_codon:yes gene_type:complete